MKTALVLTMFFGLVICSCNNEATVTVKEDSTKNKVESLGEKLDSGAERVKDSAKARWNDIKGRVEKKLENTDSTKN